jgi:hypothetical protein
MRRFFGCCALVAALLSGVAGSARADGLPSGDRVVAATTTRDLPVTLANAYYSFGFGFPGFSFYSRPYAYPYGYYPYYGGYGGYGGYAPYNSYMFARPYPYRNFYGRPFYYGRPYRPYYYRGGYYRRW